MIDFHRDSQADLTIACLPVSLARAREYGVMEVNSQHRVLSFVEKPRDPPAHPTSPTPYSHQWEFTYLIPT